MVTSVRNVGMCLRVRLVAAGRECQGSADCYGIVVQRYTLRGNLPGLGPVMINLNIDAKTNVIDVNNKLT